MAKVWGTGYKLGTIAFRAEASTHGAPTLTTTPRHAPPLDFILSELKVVNQNKEEVIRSAVSDRSIC